MNAKLKERTGILVILDGFGINPLKEFNAVKLAKTPTLNSVYEKYSSTEIQASEGFVGLPKGFMGNSEVGHLNLGAGRVVYQDFSLISHSIDEGSFYQNEAIVALCDKVMQHDNGALHLMGLLSDGGVHSHNSHLYALLQLAKRKGVKKVYVHVITDGRDTSPTSGVAYVTELIQFQKDLGLSEIASVSGRFYAMDRDNRWERVQKAYEAIVEGSPSHLFIDPLSYIQSSYEKQDTDEFILPAINKSYQGMKDGDGVIFFNFRADRAREITRSITQRDFGGFERKSTPLLSGFVCMTPYASDLNLPTAYEKPKIPNTLGEIISQKKGKQLRIAETEKYAHVTYFFNGGDEKVFEGEKRVLIPSPKEVRTYDLKPEMSAEGITEKLLEELNTNTYRFVVVNFANPDMVGHTGNLNAAIKAVEKVDPCLKKIFDWVEKNHAFAILTADHGNCEKMQDENGMPLTSHTTLPVPFVVVDPEHPKHALKSGGSLCDVAPTMLQLWGIEKPVEMTGQSLLVKR